MVSSYHLLFVVLLLAQLQLFLGDDAIPLKIVTIESEPYVRKGASDNELSGFIPELLKVVLKDEPYNLKLVADGKHGMESSGKWNGLIGELVNGNADIAAADLTISENRKAVVNFSEPFLSTTIKILKPAGLNADTLSEIANLTDIEIGAVAGGNTMALLKKSTNDDIEKISAKIKGVASVKEGVERVKKGNLIMFLEGLTSEFWEKLNSNETKTIDIKEDLGKVEFAFAVPKDSKHLAKLNNALSDKEIKKSIDKLIETYFKEGGDKNDAQDNSSTGPQLFAGSLVLCFLAILLLSF